MEEPNITKVQIIIQLKLEIAFFNKKNKMFPFNFGLDFVSNAVKLLFLPFILLF